MGLSMIGEPRCNCAIVRLYIINIDAVNGTWLQRTLQNVTIEELKFAGNCWQGAKLLRWVYWFKYCCCTLLKGLRPQLCFFSSKTCMLKVQGWQILGSNDCLTWVCNEELFADSTMSIGCAGFCVRCTRNIRPTLSWQKRDSGCKSHLPPYKIHTLIISTLIEAEI